eukprot:1131857-Prorocentrum_minimum.AAC.3
MGFDSRNAFSYVYVSHKGASSKGAGEGGTAVTIARGGRGREEERFVLSTTTSAVSCFRDN